MSLKTVYLLRHAKARLGGPEIDDHARTLSTRGRAASGILARHLMARSIAPDLVLVSSAIRTRETWELIAAQLSSAPARRIADELYLAEPHTLRKLLRGLDDALGSVMLVGHNPGLEDLAHEYAGHGDPTAIRRMTAKFPTGGLATISFRTSHWKDLSRDNARLTDFVTPSSLEPRD